MSPFEPVIVSVSFNKALFLKKKTKLSIIIIIKKARSSMPYIHASKLLGTKGNKTPTHSL